MSEAPDIDPPAGPGDAASVLAALLAQGRLAEVVARGAPLAAREPPDFKLLCILGDAFSGLEKWDRASTCYARALQIAPDDAAAYFNLGNCLFKLGRTNDAMGCYAECLKRDPQQAEAHGNLGMALLSLGRTEEAAAWCKKATDIKPGFAEAHNNLGIAFSEMGRFEDAVICFRNVLQLNPVNPDAHYNLGNALTDLGDLDAAIAIYRQALEIKPDHAEAACCLGLALVRQNNFAEGWKYYEARKKMPSPAGDREFPQPLWLGKQNIAGKRIFLHWEQGFGDCLQFCRYALQVRALGAEVVLSVLDPLLRLVSRMAPDIQVIGETAVPDDFDFHCPLMSLPLALGTTPDTIPAPIPYLSADPTEALAWRHRLAALPGLKVGLVWAGGAMPEEPRVDRVEKRRSIMLDQFAPLARIPGISWISLQKGERAAQAKAPPEGMVLHDWTDELRDFADTAALIEGLDLVISVDTSTAHLAGAMGKPVWILNRFDQCWRWRRDRADSAWYPTARLFRQERPGKWEDVLALVARELAS